MSSEYRVSRRWQEVLNASTATGRTNESKTNSRLEPTFSVHQHFPTLRPSRHQPGIAPHNLSLWSADWFKCN